MTVSKPDQLYLDGTEPPHDPARDHVADDLVYAWLDAKAQQRKSADTTKIKHASMLARLGELGVDRYPYTDVFSGKKKFVVVKREPKATTTNTPKPRKQRERKPREEKTPDEERVEHRKVSRASVESEIDPFGGVRSSMNGSSMNGGSP